MNHHFMSGAIIYGWNVDIFTCDTVIGLCYVSAVGAD